VKPSKTRGYAQGFAAAAATSAVSAFGPDSRITGVRVAQAAIVGGTVSVISGGKFENGAVTSSLQELIGDVYSENRVPGRRLNMEEREIYGDSFSDDVLSNAKIHEGETPWWLRGDAAAVTIGNDIYIRPDEYDPETTTGAALLGHELVHVEQFRGGLTIPQYILKPSAYESPAYSRQPEFAADLCRRYSASGCGPSSDNLPPRTK
jgi:hypothetical protein